MTPIPEPQPQSNEQQPAVGYTRVSTHRQISGVGLAAQAAAIQTYAEAAGYRLVQIIEEQHSATDGTPLDERPGFKQVLELANQHNAVVLVSRMDRISRNLSSFRDFIDRRRLAIIPVCEMDCGVLPGQIARAAESDVIAREKGARQAQAYDRMRSEGKRLGNPAPSSATRERSQEVRKWLASQRHHKIAEVMEKEGPEISRTDLARLLNEKGIVSAQGKPWTASMLRRDHKAAQDILKERRSNELPAKVGLTDEERKELESMPGFGIF